MINIIVNKNIFGLSNKLTKKHLNAAVERASFLTGAYDKKPDRIEHHRQGFAKALARAEL